MSEFAADQVATHWAAHDDPNQDTIVLLQEEIARLEGEIRARDEAMAHSPADTFGPEDAGTAGLDRGARAPGRGARRRACRP